MYERDPDVAAYLAAEDDEAPARPPWAVVSEDDAAWAADKVLAARERHARIVAACAAQVAAAAREVARAEGYFLPLLEDWARRHPPARGRTIHLPTGQLAFRCVPGGPRVVDDAAALSWARGSLPAAVRVVESVDKRAITAHVAATGELPPGVEVKPDDESFSVKAAS